MFVVYSRNLLRRVIFEDGKRTFSLTGFQRDDHGEDTKGKAAEKLNALLQSIIKDDFISTDSDKVVKAESKFKKIKMPRPEKPKNLGEKIVEAAKEVSAQIKGEPERTEIELLQKLLYKNENLQKSVLKATKSASLSELLQGMEVETKPVVKKLKEAEYNRAQQVRAVLGRKRDPGQRKSFPVKPMDLFGGQCLNIFKKTPGTVEDEIRLSTWEHCETRMKTLSITHPPRNIYEQMIIWTDRGMLWKFPIDNEQGMDDEKEVSFADHVFLENYIEDWCPERGPIRHFMELVCVGLSRNHWLTAAEKKAHILWYKDYFLQKKDLVKEIGAGVFKESSAPSPLVN